MEFNNNNQRNWKDNSINNNSKENNHVKNNLDSKNLNYLSGYKKNILNNYLYESNNNNNNRLKNKSGLYIINNNRNISSQDNINNINNINEFKHNTKNYFNPEQSNNNRNIRSNNQNIRKYKSKKYNSKNCNINSTKSSIQINNKNQNINEKQNILSDQLINNNTIIDAGSQNSNQNFGFFNNQKQIFIYQFPQYQNKNQQKNININNNYFNSQQIGNINMNLNNLSIKSNETNNRNNVKFNNYFQQFINTNSVINSNNEISDGLLLMKSQSSEQAQYFFNNINNNIGNHFFGDKHNFVEESYEKEGGGREVYKIKKEPMNKYDAFSGDNIINNNFLNMFDNTSNNKVNKMPLFHMNTTNNKQGYFLNNKRGNIESNKQISNNEINSTDLLKEEEIKVIRIENKNNILSIKKCPFSRICLKIKFPSNSEDNFKKSETEYLIINTNRNISEQIKSLINENSIDKDTFKSLLSLLENSIDILKLLDEIKISKYSKKSIINGKDYFDNKKENYNYYYDNASSIDDSFLLDLIEKNKYQIKNEEVFPNNKEIEKYEILNLSWS